MEEPKEPKKPIGSFFLVVFGHIDITEELCDAVADKFQELDVRQKLAVAMFYTAEITFATVAKFLPRGDGTGGTGVSEVVARRILRSALGEFRKAFGRPFLH